MKSLRNFFKKMLGRGKDGSSAEKSRRESKKSWSPEKITLALDGETTAIEAILESLEPTDFFGFSDVAELIGGNSTPSQVFGPDGRQASAAIFDTERIAIQLKEFWNTGRIFENIDDSITITQKYAEVSERFVRITLETDSKDNRVAVALYKSRSFSAMICYLEDRGS